MLCSCDAVDIAAPRSFAAVDGDIERGNPGLIHRPLRRRRFDVEG
jgi:hypothetical protein